DAAGGGADPTVNEHEKFAVTVTALGPDGSPASGYHGSVDLSFVLPNGTSWCDVTPSSVVLTSGRATAMVSLNRETVPPEAPRLMARNAAMKSGLSGKITVVAPPFRREAAPLIAPLASFGWATTVLQADVVPSASGFT